MIIHQPQKKIENGSVHFSTRIETQNTISDIPSELRYRFPESYSDHIELRGDAFLVGVLIVSMALGEDIEVQAPVSPLLVHNLEKYINIFHGWFPNLSKIKIHTPILSPLNPNNAGAEAATLFSGGVDSSFVLMSNLPNRQAIPEFQIKHALYVHGGDIPLSNPGLYKRAVDRFEAQLTPLGVNLIPCETNVRSFAESRAKWGDCLGSALISTGLALPGLINHLYVASSYGYSNMAPWGSTPVSDNLLSTESIRIEHFGADYQRADKIMALSNWGPAQKFLRVCLELDPGEAINCSRCSKCLVTMCMLEIAGVREKFVVFEDRLNFMAFLRWALQFNGGAFIIRFIIKFAKKHRRWDLVIPLYPVLLSRLIYTWVWKLTPKPLLIWLKKYVFPLDKNPFYLKNKHTSRK